MLRSVLALLVLMFAINPAYANTPEDLSARFAKIYTLSMKHIVPVIIKGWEKRTEYLTDEKKQSLNDIALVDTGFLASELAKQKNLDLEEYEKCMQHFNTDSIKLDGSCKRIQESIGNTLQIMTDKLQLAHEDYEKYVSFYKLNENMMLSIVKHKKVEISKEKMAPMMAYFAFRQSNEKDMAYFEKLKSCLMQTPKDDKCSERMELSEYSSALADDYSKFFQAQN